MKIFLKKTLLVLTLTTVFVSLSYCGGTTDTPDVD